MSRSIVLDDELAQACAGWISDGGLQEEWRNRFEPGFDAGGGMSPVEYAVLPAILDLLDDDDRGLALDLLRKEVRDRAAESS